MISPVRREMETKPMQKKKKKKKERNHWALDLKKKNQNFELY